MARVGLSKSFYAKYNVSTQDGSISYSDGGTLGKAVECEIELEDTDPTIFYADNGPAESAAAFSGGTLTITNDALPIDKAAAILGLTTSTVSTPAGTSLVFPADITPPYLGYGTVAKMIVSNTPVWRAIFLHKIQFQMPVDTFATQEDSLEFEGHELVATILRDDAATPAWRTIADFTTEANAVTWLKAQLSIS